MSRTFGTYEALDISASRLAADHDIDFPCRDADLNHDWPFTDESFDVILAMMIFERLFDPFHSFAELARVLKKGGLAFVNLSNIASFKCRFDLPRGRLPVTSTLDWFELRQWDGAHLHYFVVGQVRRVGELNRLQLKRVYPVGRMAGLKRLAPGLLCHEISYVFSK